tara:strand:+ start:1448 stop:1831 length:384 start_codon:yes stop_codon:yes gene_type:complete
MRSDKLNQKWEEINSKNPEELTNTERIWYTIEPLLQLGLIDHYINYGFDFHNETMEDLKHIGELEILNLMLEVNNKFEGEIPKDIDERNEELADINENFIEEIDNKFWKLAPEAEVRLDKFIAKNFD